MVLISNMRLVCLIGYLQTPTSAPLGEAMPAMGAGVDEINKPLKIMLFINSKVFKSEDIKNKVSFAGRVLV